MVQGPRHDPWMRSITEPPQINMQVSVAATGMRHQAKPRDGLGRFVRNEPLYQRLLDPLTRIALGARAGAEVTRDLSLKRYACARSNTVRALSL